MVYYAKETVERIKNSKHIVIYGARTVAKEVANCLLGAPYFFTIDAFMVTSMEGNPKELMGIPVLDYKQGKEKFPDAVVLVAVMEKFADEILQLLNEQGFQNVIPLTFESDLWSEIRGNYYRELRISQGREYLTLEQELDKVTDATVEEADDVHVYMAKCHVDRKINADFSKYDWEIPIQVGTALTEERIAKVCDNMGENISHKNRECCELTALYWIWKNDCSKYAGLCHYRRHFKMDRNAVAKLAHSDIDVVLTIPILNFPDVRTLYVADHIEKDWDVMLEAIEKLQPDYLETAKALQSGCFYYGYNMFIAKKEILNRYCDWLFPILFYCEEKCGRKEDKYQNRYLGFLAERLLSIFFLHHQEEYKIVHAQKEFFGG